VGAVGAKGLWQNLGNSSDVEGTVNGPSDIHFFFQKKKTKRKVFGVSQKK